MTYPRATIAAAMILSLAFCGSAAAHHAGGVSNTAGAGPINTISASTLEQGHAVAGVVVDYSRLNTLSDDTLVNATAAGIKDVHGLKTLQSFALVGAYGVTNDLMISFHLPYVKRTGIRAAEADPDTGNIEVLDHGSSDGFGDISVLGQYRVINDRASQTEAAVLFGLKAPTGPTDADPARTSCSTPSFSPAPDPGILASAPPSPTASARGRSMPTFFLTSPPRARRIPTSAISFNTMPPSLIG